MILFVNLSLSESVFASLRPFISCKDVCDFLGKYVFSSLSLLFKPQEMHNFFLKKRDLQLSCVLQN